MSRHPEASKVVTDLGRISQIRPALLHCAVMSTASSPTGTAGDADGHGQQPEPTDLLTFLSASEPPQPETVRAALESAMHGPVDMETQPPAFDDVLWSAVVASTEQTAPLAFWVEPNRMPPDEQTPAASCRWVLGLETILDPVDPLACYLGLLKLLATAWPDAAAVLDVNTTLWFPRDELDCVVRDEPPAGVLWNLQCVEYRTGADDQTRFWLHTHGLWRCARPDLEMLEVPPEHVRAAAAVLDQVADLLLLPEPVWTDPIRPLELGPDMPVRFAALARRSRGAAR